MSTPLLRLLLALLLFHANLLQTATARADSVSVRQAMQTGNIAWTSAFDLNAKNHQVGVDIRISLLTPGEINRGEFESRMKKWKQAIDSKWNRRFYAIVDGKKWPLIFNIRMTHHRPHHRVVVHSGQWVPNQHNWYLDTPPAVIAHEIGHMLGAYDEYRPGALAPTRPLIDSDSIMGANPDQGLALPRHLWLLRDKLRGLLGNENIEIVAY